MHTSKQLIESLIEGIDSIDFEKFSIEVFEETGLQIINVESCSIDSQESLTEMLELYPNDNQEMIDPKYCENFYRGQVLDDAKQRLHLND